MAQVAVPTIPDNGPTPASPLGIPPHSSSSGTNESVSMMNGSLNVYIPLLTIPQRGGYNLSIGLVHKSNSYALQQTTSVTSSVSGVNLVIDAITYGDQMATNDEPLEINLPRLQFSYEYVGDQAFGTSGTISPGGQGTITSIGNIYCATNFQFTDWSGNKHPFENVSPCNWAPGGPNTQPIYKTDSSDGSFYRLDTTTPTDMKVYSPDGTVYHFSGFIDPCPVAGTTSMNSCSTMEDYYDSRASLIVDTNGSSITVASNAQGFTLTDTLSRTISIARSNQGSGPEYYTGVSYRDSNGNQQTIGIVTQQTNTNQVTQSNPVCTYVGQPQYSPYKTPTVGHSGSYQSVPSITTITFPTSAGGGQKQYTLSFDGINRLVEIQYPFGGYTRYDYQWTGGTQVMSKVQCSVPGSQIWHKYECSSSNSSSCPEQITTYTPTPYYDSVQSITYNKTMVVTDPLQNKDEHDFATTNPVRTNPVETDVYRSGPNGKVIVHTNSVFPTTLPQNTGTISFEYNFPTQVTTTLLDVSPAISSSVNYVYEAYTALPNYGAGVIDQPTEIDTTDYTGTVIKKVSQQWKPASAFTSSPLILDRLQSRTTTDAAGSVSSTVTYGYDTSGNVTSETKTGTNVGSLTTQYERNTSGEVILVTDPMNYTTSIGYGDGWSSTGGTCGIQANSSAYPTSLTNALSQVTNYTYNACTGTVATVKDPNGVTDSYSYDALGRVISETVTGAHSEVEGQKSNSFVDSAPSSITETVSQSPDPSLVTKTAYDGFGRIQETTLVSDPDGPDLTDTTYDALGRVQSVSTPYRTFNDSTYGITSYTYDALGRKRYECHPDNTGSNTTTCTPTSNYFSWSYSNNVVTSTDEVGNRWKRTTDALGRLIKVLEPNGSTQSPTMETDYTYDALDDLLSVNQCGGTCPSSSARVRSFSYNGLAQLLTASNPESGTTSYTYDNNGNLQSKTDARSITTNYRYDALNRLWGKSYSNDPNNTPSSCYQYDMPISAATDANPTGRLTFEWTQKGGCPSTGTPARLSPQSTIPAAAITSRAFLSHDAMGRVLSEQQCRPSQSYCPTTTPYSLSHGYDVAGNRTSYSNGIGSVPGMVAITQSFDAAGRLQTIAGSLNGASSVPLFSAQSVSPAAYAPQGALQNAVYGNNVLTLTRTYDKRLRITEEIDTGLGITLPTNGSATVSIVGVEQSK